MTWKREDFDTYDQLAEQYEIDGLPPDEAEREARHDIDWERR